MFRIVVSVVLYLLVCEHCFSQELIVNLKDPITYSELVLVKNSTKGNVIDAIGRYWGRSFICMMNSVSESDTTNGTLKGLSYLEISRYSGISFELEAVATDSSYLINFHEVGFDNTRKRRKAIRHGASDCIMDEIKTLNRDVKMFIESK